MKRILYILSIIISLNLFFLLFINESEKQYKSLSYFPNLVSEYTNMRFFMTTIDADDEIFDKIYQIVSDYILNNDSLAMSIRTSNINDRLYHKYFVYAKDNFVNNLLYIQNATEVDFTSLNIDKYYSTDAKTTVNKILNIDKKIFDIKNTAFEIFPYDAFQNEIGSYNITIFSNNVDAEISKFSSYLKSNNIKFEININSEKTNLQQNKYFHPMYQLCFLSFVAYFIVLIAVLVKENKRVHIYKLHGYSSLKIASTMFSKRIVVSCLMFCISLLLLSFMKLYPFSNATSIFLTNIKLVILIFFVIHMLIFLMNVLYIRLYSKNIMIKNKYYMKSIITLNYLFKSVFICVVMGITIELVTTTLSLSSRWIDLNKVNKDRDYARVLGVDTDILNNNSLIKELLATGKVSFCDFSSSELKIYFPDKHFDPLIIVNKTYLQDYKVYDVENNIVNVDQFNEDIVLMPEQFKNKDINGGYNISNLDIIYINNNQTFYNLDSTASYLKMKSPVIVVKNDNKILASDIFDLYMELNLEYDIQYYQNVFDKYTSDTAYTMVTNSSIFEDSKRYLYINLMNTFTFVILLIVIFITFTYQNLIIYLSLFRKDLAVKTLHGYSFYGKYNHLYYLSIGTTCIPVCAYSLLQGSFTSDVLLYIGIISLFEVLFITCMLRFFEKKGIIEILKGE